MQPNGLTGEFCRRAFALPATTMQSPVQQPAATNAPPPTQPKKSAAQERVDNWLAASKGSLHHETIRQECIKLSSQQNWEMVKYAIDLLEPKCDRLEENVRLLWIIQDNLDALFTSSVPLCGKQVLKFEELKRNNHFLFEPPVMTYIKLDRIVNALGTLNAGGNNNLAAIKEHLSRWEFYFLSLQELVAAVITSRPHPPSGFMPLALHHFILELRRTNQPFLAELEGRSCLFWAVAPFECCFEMILVPAALKSNLGMLTAAGYGPCLHLADLSGDARKEIQQEAVGEFLKEKWALLKQEIGSKMEKLEEFQQLSEQQLGGVSDADFAQLCQSMHMHPAFKNELQDLFFSQQEDPVATRKAAVDYMLPMIKRALAELPAQKRPKAEAEVQALTKRGDVEGLSDFLQRLIDEKASHSQNNFLHIFTKLECINRVVTPANRRQFFDGWDRHQNDPPAFKKHLAGYFTPTEVQTIIDILAQLH